MDRPLLCPRSRSLIGVICSTCSHFQPVWESPTCFPSSLSHSGLSHFSLSLNNWYLFYFYWINNWYFFYLINRSAIKWCTIANKMKWKRQAKRAKMMTKKLVESFFFLLNKSFFFYDKKACWKLKLEHQYH